MIRLPVHNEADVLTFRCSHCGNCCTDTVVPVVATDVLRIMRATGRRAEKVVSFFPTSAFRGNGVGLAFARLDVGPRVMGLAHSGTRTCKFHVDDRCTVYDARPLVCRTFPFFLEGEQLLLNQGVDCKYERDGTPDRADIARSCRREHRQDAAWTRVIESWNDHWAGGDALTFLRYVGLSGRNRHLIEDTP